MLIHLYAIIDDDYNTIDKGYINVSNETEIKPIAEACFTKKEQEKYCICYDVVNIKYSCTIHF